MYLYKKNDDFIDVKLMEETFTSEDEKMVFLEWFLSALKQVEIVMRLRHIGYCYLCREMNTLDYKGVKKYGSYEYKIPNGERFLIVSSDILHLVSVHNFVPDKSIICALEVIKKPSWAE